MTTPNRLYFGDCLDVMREDIADESVDLIYLDPPFNSKRIYNANMGGAQWVAFNDTWQWYEAVDDFHDVAGSVELGATMEGLRQILGEGSRLAYLSYMANRLRECRRVLKSTGSIYLHCDATMNYLIRVVMDAIFGRSNFRNEIIWRYQTSSGAPARHFLKNSDTVFFYATGRGDNDFNIVREPWPDATLKKWQRDEEGRIYRTNGAKRYYIDPDGKRADNVWEMTLASRSRERLGYPTQKPLALLDRVIRASSNPGDFVLDPFCGCGTTLHAAQALERQWAGVDICVKACQVIEERLSGHFDSVWSDVEFIGMPKTTDHARKLASLDAFRFERWAASLAPWMEANKRQRADGGIDGWGRIPLRRGRFVDVVSQVKGGSTNPGHVQAFNGARQQAGADMGIFTCFEDRVTDGMRNAAASAGRFHDAPTVQIYTVEDFFAGRQPQLPRVA